MKLETYLALEGISALAFARDRLKMKRPRLLYRYLPRKDGEPPKRRPAIGMQQRIAAATMNTVTPNDWILP